jgi:GMP synthase (glutamine-hydrolysing)
VAEPRILVLQHHPLEHPGVFAAALAAAGACREIRRLDAGEACPETIAPYDGLIVMGGPMGVWDDDAHPWLGAERRLLAEVIGAGVPALGVCLGAQLLAAAAGADVRRGPVPEIGWHTIQPAEAASDDPVLAAGEAFAALEWHRDAFTLPRGAVALASSARYPLQAFRVGRCAYGLLFHLEVDPVMVRAWRHAFLAGAPLPDGDAAPDFAGANRRAVTLVERLFLGR